MQSVGVGGGCNQLVLLYHKPDSFWRIASSPVTLSKRWQALSGSYVLKNGSTQQRGKPTKTATAQDDKKVMLQRA